MKTIILIASITVVIATSCGRNSDCTLVTISQNPNGACASDWGINLNNHFYPSNNIPAVYQQQGLQVCADYQLYDDMRLCPCCGGTWADIKSMRLP